MPFDGSGNFNRTFPPGGWAGDATAGFKIEATRHDTHDKDLADGLSNCIAKDGQTQPIADIPMNGHRITHLAEPVAQDDAATLKTVNDITGWTTHKDLTGTGVEGRLNFTGLTGVNGITWSNVNAAWVTRKANADNAHERNRIVLNNTVNPGDTNFGDVMSIDVGDGMFNFPGNFDTTHNLVFDPNGNYRTPAAGTGGLWRRTATVLQAFSNNLATTVAYGTAVLENWFSISYAGSVVAQFNKKASGQAVQLVGQMGGVARWIIEMGNSTAEAADNSGSDFAIHGYNNAGGYAPGQVMLISRKTGAATFSNTVTAAGVFASSTADLQLCGLGGTGRVFLRPRGAGNAAGQFWIDGTGGEVFVAATGGIQAGKGIREQIQSTGAGVTTGDAYINFNHVSGNTLNAYIDNTIFVISGTLCDYRIKQAVEPLASVWDKVKALNPISYRFKNYDNHIKDDGKVRWGFLAHEMQAMTPSAATSEKDGTDLQGLDLVTVIAGLTRALQEAMERIEALEAK